MFAIIICNFVKIEFGMHIINISTLRVQRYPVSYPRKHECPGIDGLLLSSHYISKPDQESSDISIDLQAEKKDALFWIFFERLRTIMSSNVLKLLKRPKLACSREALPIHGCGSGLAINMNVMRLTWLAETPWVSTIGGLQEE